MASTRRLEMIKLRVASNVGPADELLTLGPQVRRWQEWRLGAAGGILAILPFNQRILVDLLAGAYLLLLSSTADLAGFVLDANGSTWRWFSLGAFVASIPPFFVSWAFYVLLLSREFTDWKAGFQRAESDARSWLDRDKGE